MSKNQFTIIDLNGLILLILVEKNKLIVPMNGVSEEMCYYIHNNDLL